MKTILILEKRTSLVELMQMFKKKQEITILEIKQKIPSAAFYTSILPKLFEINKILAGSSPSYFIRPEFIKENKSIRYSLKMHHNIEIEIAEKFIVLKYEKD